MFRLYLPRSIEQFVWSLLLGVILGGCSLLIMLALHIIVPVAIPVAVLLTLTIAATFTGACNGEDDIIARHHGF